MPTAHKLKSHELKLQQRRYLGYAAVILEIGSLAHFSVTEEPCYRFKMTKKNQKNILAEFSSTKRNSKSVLFPNLRKRNQS